MNEAKLTLGQSAETVANRLSAAIEYTRSANNLSNLRTSLKSHIGKDIWNLQRDNSVHRIGRRIFTYSFSLEPDNALKIFLNGGSYRISNPDNQTELEIFGLNTPEMTILEQDQLTNELGILTQSLINFLDKY